MRRPRLTDETVNKQSTRWAGGGACLTETKSRQSTRWAGPAAVCLLACCLWVATVGGEDLPPPDGQLPPETLFPADAGCPCLSAEAVAARVYASGSAVVGSCPNGTLPADLTAGTAQGPQCLDYRLGSASCRAWGHIQPVCEAHKQVSYYIGSVSIEVADEEVAKWCDQGWCYVDPQVCGSPVEPSSLFPEADLWYSYETCGFVDTFGPRLLEKRLTSVGRSTLRYSYPDDSGARVWTRETGERTGSFPAIFEKLADIISASSDIDFQQVEITDVARGAVSEMFGYSSSYTACAVMIAYNKTDVCIGPHWSLLERHSMAHYVYSWDGDTVYLIAYAKQVESGQLLGGIFLPFTAEVWIALALAVVVTILLFGSMEVSPRMSATFAPAAEHSKALGLKRLHTHLTYATQVILLSIEGVLDFHPEGYNPLSVAGKLLKAAWVMFMVIFMSTYTANLAAILAGQSPTEFTSIQDAISKKASICVPSPIADKLADLIPGLSALAVPLLSAEVFPAMDKGVCRAGVLFDAQYDIRAPEHRNKVAVGSPILSLPVAMLSQPFVSQHLNLAVESLSSNGITQLIKEEYIQIYDEEVNGNVGGLMDNSTSESSERLSLVHMSSLFILFSMAVVVAVCCDLFERFFPWLITRSRAIPFEVAEQSGPGHLYLRDDYKDTYSISLPPGLRPPKTDFDADGPPDEPQLPLKRWNRASLDGLDNPAGPGTPGSTDLMLPTAASQWTFDAQQ